MSKVSMLSLLLIIYITIFVILRFDKMSSLLGPSEDTYIFLGDDITQSIGIIVFAYMCHHSSFLLYGSLENPTQPRWDRVTHYSVGISCIIVIIFGTAGYATFKSLSQGDLFENYCLGDDGANIARLLFTITIMLTYPIECFVVREVLENVFWPCKELLTKRHHLMLTVSIVAITFLLSTLTDCLGVVLELNVSTSQHTISSTSHRKSQLTKIATHYRLKITQGVATALPLAFILPSACYIKLETGHPTGSKKLYALLLLVFGCSVASIGTIKIMLNIFFGHSMSNCSHGHELEYCYKNQSHLAAVSAVSPKIIATTLGNISTLH